MTGRDVAKILYSYRFTYGSEADLHAGVAQALRASGVAFTDECRLDDAGIIDFLTADGVGIELKVKGSPAAVLRQLIQYAECPKLVELVLVTGRASLGQMPATLQGKPFHVVSLWRSVL